MKWLDSITDSMDMNLSKLWEIMKDRQPWRGAVQRVRLDLTSEQQSLHKGSATSIVIGLLGFQCLLKPILVIFIFLIYFGFKSSRFSRGLTLHHIK